MSAIISEPEKMERRILGELSFYANERSHRGYGFHLNGRVGSISWANRLAFSATFGRSDCFCLTCRNLRLALISRKNSNVPEFYFDPNVNRKIKKFDDAFEIVVDQIGVLETDVSEFRVALEASRMDGR